MEETLRSEIIQYLVDKYHRLGKVQLQKTIYFLQEVFQVPTGYDYVMHYYGPYSFDLDDTLSEMQGNGVLSINNILYPAGYIGYDISLGKNARSDLKLASKYKDKVDQVVNIFKPMDAQTLELWATIHFVNSILDEKGKDSSKETVVREVNLLKPKFSEKDIENNYNEMQNKGLL
jgi:uncharacterized protein YwgA